MELVKKFPEGFFDKVRPSVSSNKTDVLPIKWSKQVLNKTKKAVVCKVKI